MIQRNLDGCYFRVERNGEYENVCFSDLTNQERNKVCEGKSVEWLMGLVFHLADRLQEIGEELDLECGDIEK